MKNSQQYWETEQKNFEQAILSTVAWDMERNLSNWGKMQRGFDPLRAEGQRQLLLAYCALEGNIVAQHILSKQFWYTNPEEMLSHWGYPVGVVT